MSKNVVESCDCCGKTVQETGFKGDTERIYRRRVRLWEWLTGSWLGWRLVGAEWQTICGECWDAIGEAVSVAALTGTTAGPSIVPGVGEQG